MKRKLTWSVLKQVIVFEDRKTLQAWVRDGAAIHFHFDSRTADDGGESIFEEPKTLRRKYTLNSNQVVVVCRGREARISIRVPFFAIIKASVADDSLSEWFAVKGGHACGYIDLGKNLMDRYDVSTEESCIELSRGKVPGMVGAVD